METSKQMYKQQGHISLFDSEETMDKLNAMGVLWLRNSCEDRRQE